MPIAGTFIDRFWSKVDRFGDCWLWTGGKNSQGYGSVYLPMPNHGPRRVMQAHRVSFLIAHGPFDIRLMVCHACDNPSCVNPAHLFLGDARDNAMDMSRKGRARGQERTHCPQGHEYTPENTYLYAKPGLRRYCRACARDRSARRGDAAYWRAYRAKRRAQGRPVGRHTDPERLGREMDTHEQGGCG